MKTVVLFLLAATLYFSLFASKQAGKELSPLKQLAIGNYSPEDTIGNYPFDASEIGY